MAVGKVVRGLRALTPVWCLLGVFGVVQPSVAEVEALSSLAAPKEDSSAFFDSSQWIAIKFLAGDAGRVSKVELDGASGFAALSSGTRVRFYDDNGGSVGSPITDGSATDGTSAYIPYASDDGDIITFAGEVVDLPVSGTYWIVFSSDNAQSVYYWSSTSLTFSGEPGWTLDSFVTINDGTTWQTPSDDGYYDQYRIVLDKPGISVTPSSGLMTTESGGTDSFSVSLDAQPTSAVTLDLSSSDTSEATVSPSSLTFTSDNWDTAQTATVTGVDDAIADGDASFTIQTAASSSDTAYDGLDPADVTGSNSDNDSPGITVSDISGNTSEAGTTTEFTVVLGSEPTADVAIDLSSDDTSEGTVSPSELTFTPSDWDTTQTVTVTGVDDSIIDGDQAYNVMVGPSSSGDPNYDGRDPGDVAVTNTDDDSADPAEDSNDDGLSDADALAAGLDPEVADGDTDGDGVSDVDEVRDPKAPLDSDGDGVIDALEPGAAANDPAVIAFQVTRRQAEAVGADDLADTTVTLTDENGGALEIPASQTTPLMGESQAARADSGYRFPLGLVTFSAAAPGGQTTVTLELPDSVDVPGGAVLRKLDANQSWQRFDAGTIDAEAGRITLPLTDNDAFDANPDAGVIKDPVGLAVTDGGSGGGNDSSDDDRTIMAGGIGWPALALLGLLLTFRRAHPARG